MNINKDYLKLQIRVFLAKYPWLISALMVTTLASLTITVFIFAKQPEEKKYVAPVSKFTELPLPKQVEAYVFSKKELIRPMGISVTNDNDLYISGAASRNIFTQDQASKKFAEFRLKEALKYPVALANAADKLIIADLQEGRVKIYSTQGKLLATLPRSKDAKKIGALKPIALTMGTSQTIYVADASKQRILAFNFDGALLFSFGKPGQQPGQFKYVNGLAMDKKSQKLYVADSNNGRVQVFNRQGKFLKILQKFGNLRLVSPRGLAIDDKRNLLYIADTITHQIFIYNFGSGKSGVMGSQGTGAGNFNFPNALAVDRKGKLYITDRDNQRLLVYDYQ